ncbi:MAG: RNA polymerase sigma factor [Acidimicrobiia bacterium]
MPDRPRRRKTDQELFDLALQVALPKVGYDRDLAGNAASETIRKLHRWRDRLDPDAVEGWVRVVAKNEAKEQLKRNPPPVPVGFRGSEPPPAPPVPGRGGDDTDGGGSRSARAERAAEAIRAGLASLGSEVADRIVVGDALGFLTDDLRQIVEMRYFDKATSTEIGRQLGLPPGTVRRKLAEARALLEEVLGAAAQDLLS